MRPFTDGDKERVQQINLAAFIEDRLGLVPMSKAGGRITFCSPFREEKEPSFTVSYYHGKWRWRDWGAEDDHGDIIALVERLWRVDFKEAMRLLLSEEYPPRYFQGEQTPKEEMTREQKIAYASKIYLTTLKVNNLDTVIAYFEGKGVHYHPQMGSSIYTNFHDRKVYVATPIPSPGKIRGLECRELKGTGRKTIGVKTLWVLKRDVKKVLVTESILDSLAGEILLGDADMSLCALNTAANVGKLEDFLSQYHPHDVLLGLDNDAAGQKATAKALEILKDKRMRAEIVKDHIQTGVKDLHKLLVPVDSENNEEAGP